MSLEFQVQDVFTYMKNAFHDRIDGITWMNKSSKAEAKLKVV